MNRISIQRRQRKWTASKMLFATYSGILSLHSWLCIHCPLFAACHLSLTTLGALDSVYKSPTPTILPLFFFFFFINSSTQLFNSTLQLNSSTQLTHLVCTYSFLLVYPGLMDTSTLVTHLSPCLRWSCTTTAAVERISRTTASFQTISPHINSTFSQRESGSSSDTFRLGFSSCHLSIAIHSSTLRDLQSSVKDDSQQTSTPPILFQFPSK